jgi:hypothetical protein
MTACGAYSSLSEFWVNGAIFDGIRCTFVGPLPESIVLLVAIGAPLMALVVASRRVIVPFVVVAFAGAALVTQLPAGIQGAVGVVVLTSIVAIGYIAWQRVVSFRG